MPNTTTTISKTDCKHHQPSGGDIAMRIHFEGKCSLRMSQAASAGLGQEISSLFCVRTLQRVEWIRAMKEISEQWSKSSGDGGWKGSSSGDVQIVTTKVFVSWPNLGFSMFCCTYHR